MTILPNDIAIIDGDTHIGEWVKQTGRLTHEPWLAEQLTAHLKEGDTAIDGGANIGTLTLPMLEAGARVIAFESNPDAVECLLHNCQHEKLTVYGGCALSESPDDMVTVHRDANAGASYCTPRGEIPCYAIDELELPELALIKLDIEGFEARALRGAKRTIARCHPVLFVEVNRGALERAGDSEDGLWALIESFGYDIRVAQPDLWRGCEMYDVVCTPCA